MTAMKYRFFILPAFVAGFVCSSGVFPALAQNTGRFTFQTVEGGVIRLDSESGQISHCLRTGADYICRSVADDRTAIDEDVTRLKRENDSLRQQLAAAKTNGPAPKLTLPSEEEIDKAMSLFERMMRRMMRTFQDEAPAPNRL
jgi:hypothetical protein